jgi:hypothetical protein
VPPSHEYLGAHQLSRPHLEGDAWVLAAHERHEVQPGVEPRGVRHASIALLQSIWSALLGARGRRRQQDASLPAGQRECRALTAVAVDAVRLSGIECRLDVGALDAGDLFDQLCRS